MEKQRKSGGTKKHGRNKNKCQLYMLRQQREKNKIRKWRKLVKKLNPASSKELTNRIKSLESKIIENKIMGGI